MTEQLTINGATFTAEFISIGLKMKLTRTGGLWMDSRPLLAESQAPLLKLHCRLPRRMARRRSQTSEQVSDQIWLSELYMCVFRA